MKNSFTAKEKQKYMVSQQNIFHLWSYTVFFLLLLFIYFLFFKQLEHTTWNVKLI